MQCARHPKVETALSCGRCGTPICPDCAIAGAVGLICRDCASNKSADYYKIEPKRLVIATIVGAFSGVLVGFLLQALVGAFLYFSCFVGPMLGTGVGEIIWRVSGRKRGLSLELLAGISIFFGVIGALVVSGHWRYLLINPFALGIFAVSFALTIIAAVSKLRYF